MKIILSIFFCLSTVLVFGQALSIDDLKKIYTLNKDDAETYLLNKNYQLATVDTNYSDKHNVMISYKDLSKSPKGVVRSVFLHFDSIFIIHSLGYGTNQTKEYLSFKNYCKSHGLKLTDTQTEHNSFINYYENDKWTISLGSVTYPTDVSNDNTYMLIIRHK